MDETFEERQKRENEEYYRKWLACGFKDEIPINEYGCFVPVLRLHYPVETLTVFDKRAIEAALSIVSSPTKDGLRRQI